MSSFRLSITEGVMFKLKSYFFFQLKFNQASSLITRERERERERENSTLSRHVMFYLAENKQQFSYKHGKPLELKSEDK